MTPSSLNPRISLALSPIFLFGSYPSFLLEKPHFSFRFFFSQLTYALFYFAAFFFIPFFFLSIFSAIPSSRPSFTQD